MGTVLYSAAYQSRDQLQSHPYVIQSIQPNPTLFSAAYLHLHLPFISSIISRRQITRMEGVSWFQIDMAHAYLVAYHKRKELPQLGRGKEAW